MSHGRFVSCVACLVLALGSAVAARAKTYSLTGGGGQLVNLGQLPMPVQVLPPSATGTVLPPLGVPAKINATIQGTTAMAVQQRITVPAGVLSWPAQQGTVGVFAQNPGLYAVATNLSFAWPASPAVLSTNARTGAKTATFSVPSGGATRKLVIRYSNPLPAKFGGPAQFAIAYGPTGGRIPAAPVTLYALAAKASGGTPPCTHTSLTPTPFPGPGDPYCAAGLGASSPPLRGAIGAPALFFTWRSGNLYPSTCHGPSCPPPAPVPGVGFGKFGANPPGTVSYFTFTPNGTRPGWVTGFSSWGFPWTTGMITLSVPTVHGGTQVLMLTGMDDRTPGGAGNIQLVAGGLSQRLAAGPVANRGWIRLQLVVGPAAVAPAMSPLELAAAAGLMLLAVAYFLRRRFSA